MNSPSVVLVHIVDDCGNVKEKKKKKKKRRERERRYESLRTWFAIVTHAGNMGKMKKKKMLLRQHYSINNLFS